LSNSILVDKSWTLFLDRDGVINKRRIDDYVKSWDEFIFLEQVPETIAAFSKIVGTIVIVTNQQGIGKKLMTVADLNEIHQNMVSEINAAGGRIDKIYYCPKLKTEELNCRKPLPSMGLSAQKDFPNIDFSKSIMVGDSVSDMEFGEGLGMTNIFISEDETKSDAKVTWLNATKLCDLTSILQDKAQQE
jgi:histidinol-phosphate phosphatase family protein